MYNHAPENYICPICLPIKGIESDATMIKQADIFYQDDLLTAFIASKFVGNNPGHPIIVPNEHYENFYDLPEDVATRIMILAKKLSIAVKEIRNGEGVTILQTNEIAGGQHAFHYHLHVFPRFTDDAFVENLDHTRVSLPEERLEYAQKLREYFE